MQVMLDKDLAELYGVNTMRLNEQVRRNMERFPESFCFQLSKEEMAIWISQFAISNSKKRGFRKQPCSGFNYSEIGLIEKETGKMPFQFEYFIDLLPFNRTNQFLVAIELKVGEFIPKYKSSLSHTVTKVRANWAA
jgi:hypothetical protein